MVSELGEKEIMFCVDSDEAIRLEAVSSNSSRDLDLYNCSNTPANSRLFWGNVHFKSSNQASKESNTNFILIACYTGEM
jgi:hypothetical protein